jgi:serine protease Do
MKAGDVIVAVDGKPVEYVAQLQEAIAFRKPGDVVNVQVARKGGQRVTLHVPLQRVDGAKVASASKDDNGSDNAAGSAMHKLGVSVEGLDANTAKQLRLPVDVHGVIVTGVEDGSSAGTHLAAPDNGGPDVIESVEGKTVNSPDDLRAALAGTKSGDIVSLRVYNVPAKQHRIERVRIG